MRLGRKEVALLMRSMIRSLPKTPEREKKAHGRLYSKLNVEYHRLLQKVPK
ncbi:MAG: hypothetical protein GTN93_21435 [Anaerolineae bacterium]|nr:hypothetical protein [Anaerolineae bacterium]